MSLTEAKNGITADQMRHHQIDSPETGDLPRRIYLQRRQRKAILENCRRIAVVGASTDSNDASFVAIERLLGLGLEILPVFSDRESFLGLRCYRSLHEIPGKIDIVLVYSCGDIDLVEQARAAIIRGVSTFWIEPGVVASSEAEEILVAGRVQLVEYENLEREYLKHIPIVAAGSVSRRHDKKAAKVKERMATNPATIQPDAALKDAISKMEHGRFRHLPVVDDCGKLVGMLTDRDIRLIRPSLAFVGREDAAVQTWSIAVQQAAVFDPVSVKPETTLKQAAEMMLRWQVGGLPVVDEQNKVVGMITYTDILRGFAGAQELG